MNQLSTKFIIIAIAVLLILGAGAYFALVSKNASTSPGSTQNPTMHNNSSNSQTNNASRFHCLDLLSQSSFESISKQNASYYDFKEFGTWPKISCTVTVKESAIQTLTVNNPKALSSGISYMIQDTASQWSEIKQLYGRGSDFVSYPGIGSDAFSSSASGILVLSSNKKYVIAGLSLSSSLWQNFAKTIDNNLNKY